MFFVSFPVFCVILCFEWFGVVSGCVLCVIVCCMCVVCGVVAKRDHHQHQHHEHNQSLWYKLFLRCFYFFWIILSTKFSYVVLRFSEESLALWKGEALSTNFSYIVFTFSELFWVQTFPTLVLLALNYFEYKLFLRCFYFFWIILSTNFSYVVFMFFWIILNTNFSYVVLRFSEESLALWKGEALSTNFSYIVFTFSELFWVQTFPTLFLLLFNYFEYKLFLHCFYFFWIILSTNFPYVVFTFTVLFWVQTFPTLFLFPYLLLSLSICHESFFFDIRRTPSGGQFTSTNFSVACFKSRERQENGISLHGRSGCATLTVTAPLVTFGRSVSKGVKCMCCSHGVCASTSWKPQHKTKELLHS